MRPGPLGSSEFPIRWLLSGSRHRSAGNLMAMNQVLDDAVFKLILGSAPDGVLVADRDGLIVWVSAEVESLFGYAREELVGKPIDLLVPERSRAAHVAHRT